MARPKPPPPKAPSAAQRKKTVIKTEQYLREALAEAHRDLDLAREDGSWQAVATLTRQATILRAELDKLVSPTAASSAPADPLANASDDEVRAALVEAVRTMPESVLTAVEDAIAARRTGVPLLTVHTGGSS